MNVQGSEGSVFGPLNEHALGIIMREAVRRSMRHARRHIFDAIPETKGTKADGGADVVTVIDRECQQIIVKMFRECFPHAGILAEEKDLRVNLDSRLWLVVDPIDGTKSFVMQESFGFACAVACVRNDEVVAVCVGEIMSGDVYFFRPGSNKTHRILHGSGVKDFAIDQSLMLSQQKVLLRDSMRKHSPLAQRIVDGDERRVALFKKYDITGGSIAAHMARLWKGSVGGTILRPGVQYPWDIIPVIGMCKRLGFVFRMPEALRTTGVQGEPALGE